MLTPEMTLLFASVGLISTRLLPVFVVAPVGSFRRVPIMARIILVYSMAIIFGFVYPAQLNNSLGLTLYSLVPLLFSEFLIGASLAFSFHCASASVHTMGKMIDLQVGFSAASIFDPNTEQLASLTGELFTLCLLVLFITLNVHHHLLSGFSKLLFIIQPGASIKWHSAWLKILGSIYLIAFIIVSPVFIILWFTDLVLAFISRSLPQTPIYFVGLPVKIVIGLATLSWFLSRIDEPFFRIFIQSLNSWSQMFRV